MKNKAALAVATWFGCGYSPKAPGTVGSAAAVLIAMALHRWAGFEAWQVMALGLAACAPAVWASDVTARTLKLKDPQPVVVDEVVGQWIAVGGAHHLHWGTWLAAFALFRLFDIWKPAPVRQLERLRGGLGIVADDAMAGCYAALVLFLAGCFNL
jgi:phosphatidylglycerophosphatase A